MKIMTIIGTRPEIIRLSRVIPLLDKSLEHVLVHTGQNYERRLNEIFFDEMEIRQPDYLLNCRQESPMGQIGMILTECEKLLHKEKPLRLLLLGDTNSALSAFVAKRMGIQVFHMEAGNRCYDDRVPEEVNRRIIDQSSDILMPYTHRSCANLVREGIPRERIFVTGNPIKEVLDFYSSRIQTSKILDTLGLKPQGYFLVTLHRSENVDDPHRLASFLRAFDRLQAEFGVPVICSLHPRTRSQLEAQGKNLGKVCAIDPPGFFDFVCLEQHAKCTLSDSGTVQEECCIFKVPNVTLRDVTERPETIEVGSNILSGSDPEKIVECVNTVLSRECNWKPPAEYLAQGVSCIVTNILTSHMDH